MLLHTTVAVTKRKDREAESVICDVCKLILAGEITGTETEENENEATEYN